MAVLLYEVLLYAERPGWLGPKGRWYLASTHPDIVGAEAVYRRLELDFPSGSVALAIVRSEHDPSSGRFADRVVHARGRIKPIGRASLTRLDEAARQTILEWVSQGPAASAAPPPDPELAPAGAMPVQPKGHSWAWFGFMVMTVGLFAAVATAG